MRYAKDCSEPAYEYFKAKFDNDLKPVVEAFKATHYFSPFKVTQLKPTAAEIDSLRSFPFLDAQHVIDNLKLELPEYIMAAADGVSMKVDPLQWWKEHEEKLPNWAKACKLALLVQPSSAAAESFFNSFELLQLFTD